jgi:hypothetical protein
MSRRPSALTARSVNAFDVASLYALSRRCYERNIASHQQRDLFAVVDRIGNLRTFVLKELLSIAETTVGGGEHARLLADLVGSTRPRMVALANELEGHRQSVAGRASLESPGPRIFASTPYPRASTRSRGLRATFLWPLARSISYGLTPRVAS